MSTEQGGTKLEKIEQMTYEEAVQLLDQLLNRLDNSETPIDKLAEEVKLGARLIKDLNRRLRRVETEVRDAFKELEGEEEQQLGTEGYPKC